MAKRDETLSTTEVAELLDVHRNTVINWIREGHIVPDSKTFGRYARFKRSSVRSIQRRLASKLGASRAA